MANKQLYIGVELTGRDKPGKKQDKSTFGIIPIPEFLPRIVVLPGKGLRYMLLEQVILRYADQAFPLFELLSKAVLCVTRNADITPDDIPLDDDADFRSQVKKTLKQRARLSPVRLEIQSKSDKDSIARYFGIKLSLLPEQIFFKKSPLSLNYVFQLEDKLPQRMRQRLMFPPFEPQYPVEIDPKKSMIQQVIDRDLLLYFPFESFEPFLQLLKEAASDPAVFSIKISIYRLSSRSKLVDHLVTAAENHKEVTVLMELRARFDEANNINWTDILEEAGCNIIYGLEDFKVHSKICLITRRDQNGLQHITQVGTGNYNEKTVKLYTDLSLITADEGIGEDANQFFRNMAIANLKGQYQDLLVAPANLKQGLLQLINEEIARAKKDGSGRILFKLNSLTERDIIDKLSEASQAGVEIDLIIRGICCLLPGIPGKTDRIRVISIVGRFLEHPRIFCFGEGDHRKIYIGSSDAMTRNLNRRVEVLCPVKDAQNQEYITHILSVMLSDTAKARVLQSDGTYRPQETLGPPVNSQEFFIEEMKSPQQSHESQQETEPQPVSTALRRMLTFFK